MTPRQEWFRKRIEECLDELFTLNMHLKIDHDWMTFKNKAHELACELLYATTEWDKHYRDISK